MVQIKSLSKDVSLGKPKQVKSLKRKASPVRQSLAKNDAKDKKSPGKEVALGKPKQEKNLKQKQNLPPVQQNLNKGVTKSDKSTKEVAIGKPKQEKNLKQNLPPVQQNLNKGVTKSEKSTKEVAIGKPKQEKNFKQKAPPVLQFASSDEDEDEIEALSDEELDDEELLDEELLDEDLVDEALLDEENEENKVDEEEEEDEEENEVGPIKKARFMDEKSILEEERRRFLENQKRTLFSKNLLRDVGKNFKVSSLHPDILTVNNKGPHVYLVFANEETAERAYKQLKDKKLPKGKLMHVDYCGPKSEFYKKKAEQGENLQPKGDFKIDKTKLSLGGVPKNITDENLRLIFPTVSAINSGKKANRTFHGKRSVVLTFPSEDEAIKVFNKSDSLKIGGLPVRLAFYRIHENKAKNTNKTK